MMPDSIQDYYNKEYNKLSRLEISLRSDYNMLDDADVLHMLETNDLLPIN